MGILGISFTVTVKFKILNNMVKHTLLKFVDPDCVCGNLQDKMKKQLDRGRIETTKDQDSRRHSLKSIFHFIRHLEISGPI